MNNITEGYLDYLDIVDLNEQQLKEHMVTMIIESKVSVAKMEKSYKTNLNVVEKFLKSYKVNLGFIKSSAKKAGYYISNQHKKGIPAKQTSKDMVKNIGKKTISKVISQVKTASEAMDLELTDKVLRSIAIFVVLFFTSSLLASIAAVIIIPVFGAPMATAFAAVVIAPFMEEYAKRFALLQKYPFIYTGIFAGIEALMYIVVLTTQGLPLLPVIIARALAVGLHFSTTHIQKLFHDKGKELNDKQTSITGYYVAVGVHSLWNFLSLIPMLLK